MAPRRTTTYSSQAGPSRRRERPPPVSSDESEGEDETYTGDQAVDAPDAEETLVGARGLSEADLNARAGQLVRFALFQEYKKNLIRRGDINKNVLPNNPRAFNAVFARAQQIMRDTIGCEMYEVRAKTKGDAVNGVDGEATQTQAQTQAQTQTQTQRARGRGRARADGDEDGDEDDDGDVTGPTKRAKTSGTKAYVLRSILPASLVEAMANPAPLPLGAQADDREGEDSGALIQWEKGDGTGSGHIALLGVRTVILAIVMTLGRVVSDDQLHAYLRRLNLHRDTILPYVSADSRDPPLTLDKYMDLLAKQAYLDKVKLPAPAGNPEGQTYEWRWGQREAEFSESDAAMFIEQIMLGREEDDSEEEEDARDNRRRQTEQVDKAAQRKKLRLDIVKATGSALHRIEV
ncbi:hypothetical protein IAU60_005979 [Kwoniella sp. DSM 27419]